jgi:hypothetical protein
VLSELDAEPRPFTVGHPAHPSTRLPARDGRSEGGVERSNRFPNCSYFTNWTSIDGIVRWPVDVLEAGRYHARLLYACPESDLGARIELRFGEQRVEARVATAHDPPLRGPERDRSPRQESCVKDFAPLDLGSLELPAGEGTLELRALEIPGRQALEVRMLLLRRVE